MSAPETVTCARCGMGFRVATAPHKNTERGQCRDCGLPHWCVTKSRDCRVGVEPQNAVHVPQDRRRVA